VKLEETRRREIVKYRAPMIRIRGRKTLGKSQDDQEEKERGEERAPLIE